MNNEDTADEEGVQGGATQADVENEDRSGARVTEVGGGVEGKEPDRAKGVMRRGIAGGLKPEVANGRRQTKVDQEGHGNLVEPGWRRGRQDGDKLVRPNTMVCRGLADGFSRANRSRADKLVAKSRGGRGREAWSLLETGEEVPLREGWVRPAGA